MESESRLLDWTLPDLDGTPVSIDALLKESVFPNVLLVFLRHLG